jgi:hypothetical protein
MYLIVYFSKWSSYISYYSTYINLDISPFGSGERFVFVCVFLEKHPMRAGDHNLLSFCSTAGKGGAGFLQI